MTPMHAGNCYAEYASEQLSAEVDTRGARRDGDVADSGHVASGTNNKTLDSPAAAGIIRAGLSIVPVVPWKGAPPIERSV